MIGLTSVVVGSMIGGGAFELPSNIAKGAGFSAIVIAWCITGIGMYALATSFRILSNSRRDLDTGIFAYAAEGFGHFSGFLIAWGYWLSSVFANVAFAVLLIKTLGFYIPSLQNLQTPHSLILASILFWTFYFIVRQGVKKAVLINMVATAAKLIPLLLFIVFCLFTIKSNAVDAVTSNIMHVTEDLGSTMSQVKSTMLVTLWVFIGIEGAVVISGRASRPEDVGRATIIGLFLCLAFYIAISLLSFGIMNRSDLAALPAPSTAYVLNEAMGPWGATLINIGVLISLMGAWLSWTILIAEVPYRAAQQGLFPKFLGKKNKFDSPQNALFLSTVLMQITYFVAAFAENAWLFLISITGVMILPAYLTSSLFLIKIATQSEPMKNLDMSQFSATAIGIAGSVYAIWLLYAAGLNYLLMSFIIFGLSTPLYIVIRRKMVTEKL